MRLTAMAYFLGCLTALLVVWGCEDKPDLPNLVEAQRGDTSYIQVYPAFGTYVGAEDVTIGRDELLYVADTRANRVVMLNRAGQFLSARSMLHPISLSQNTRLDLYVGGEMLSTNGDTIGAIFRLRLYSVNPDSAHRLEVAPMDTIWREPARPNRRFPGLAVFDDNSFIAVRSAVPFPDNTSTIDPDARVLLFSRTNTFITPIPAFTSGIGGGITTLNNPTAVAAIQGSRDFVLVQAAADTIPVGLQYGALWMRFESNTDFEGWLPKYDPANLIDRNVDFIRTYRYLYPSAVAVDGVRKDVFVADAALDSVFKFNSRGRIKSESFGFARSGGVMSRPTGLTYFEKVLYVLDSPSGLILRFRLTTDVPR